MVEITQIEPIKTFEANEIPIHFIWLGKPMPKMIRKCFLSLLNVYKDNPVYFWTEPSVVGGIENLYSDTYGPDQEVNDAMKAHIVQIGDVHNYDDHRIFKECTFPYQAEQKRHLQPDLRFDTLSDAYRYAILEEFGGLYVDSDFYHFKSYAGELAKHDAALGQCDQLGRHGNGFLYVSQPDHPYIKEIIDQCISLSDIAFHRLAQIGPRACYKARNKLIKESFEVFSVPYDQFFSFNWEDTDGMCCTAHNENRQPEVCYYSDMYAVHLWYDVFKYWSDANDELEFQFKEIQRDSAELLAKKQEIIKKINDLQKQLYELR